MIPKIKLCLGFMVVFLSQNPWVFPRGVGDLQTPRTPWSHRDDLHIGSTSPTTQSYQGAGLKD